MTKPGTTLRRQWRGGLWLGVLAGLALGGVALADGSRDAARPAAGGVQQAAAIRPAAATANRDQDRRRMLMLLVMHSAGRLGPYGGLGH
jgi:hypothetical protein